jgi:hypothetical protein
MPDRMRDRETRADLVVLPHVLGDQDHRHVLVHTGFHHRVVVLAEHVRAHTDSDLAGDAHDVDRNGAIPVLVEDFVALRRNLGVGIDALHGV